MKIIFWSSCLIVFYTFLGYGILLYLLICIRRLFKGRRSVPEIQYDLLPSCTLVVAAYNEEQFIEEKVLNSLSLCYPPDQLKLVFVTDGSTDKTNEIIKRYPEIKLLFQPLRKGKIAAVHRAVESVDSDILIFTDANTTLNKDALLKIARHYADPLVGAVAGEKRVHFDAKADASAAGEGFYWKYESILKKWDSELWSVVGAAGELFSIRRSLYQPVEKSAILDDFMISMLIGKKGFRIVYEPESYAVETASEDVSEELKRKVRIAAGGIQSVIWLKALLNPFRYGALSLQYISHRVLRWTITPFLLIIAFFSNFYLVFESPAILYKLFFLGQIIFYLCAALGVMLEKKQLRIKAFFVPYYFSMMNFAVIAGIGRYLRKNQPATWDKAKRKLA